MSIDRLARPAAWLLGVLAVLLCGNVLATPRIGVLTIGPGNEYWSRFGHNALLVDAGDGAPTVYNYGYFDFEQPGFLLRFLRGRMLYRVIASPLDYDLGYYAEEGRGVSLQWLQLPDGAAEQLAAYLAWNVRPENADYRYDYFTANCSTRVRDAIDQAIAGELKRQTDGRSRGLSYRSEALRLSSAEPWMYYGVHLMLGVATDRPISRWGESFVPERLHDALSLVTLPDGRKLVEEEQQLLPHRLAPAPAAEPRFALAAALLGGALATTLLRFGRRPGLAGKLTRALLAMLWIIGGLAGLLMAALWLGTDHAAAWANRNLLLCNPLMLLLLATLWRGSARDYPAWPRWLAGFLLLSGVAAVALHFLPVQGQDSLEWLLLWLPIHAATWRLQTAPPPASAG